MRLHQLREGLLDLLLGKKKKEPQMVPLTDDQRILIKKHFKNSNVDLKFGGPTSKYVLELNAHASHGKGRISFRNEDGKLKASVAYHKTESDVGNPKAIPLIHYDVDIDSEADIDKLIKELV